MYEEDLLEEKVWKTVVDLDRLMVEYLDEMMVVHMVDSSVALMVASMDVQMVVMQVDGMVVWWVDQMDFQSALRSEGTLAVKSDFDKVEQMDV